MVSTEAFPTVMVSSLSPESTILGEIDLREIKLIVADVDYTLLDTDVGHAAGIAAIRNVLGDDFAQTVNNLFYLTVAGHRHQEDEEWTEKKQFQNVVKRTQELHLPFFKLHGHKAWSRETWIVLAAEKLQKAISPELVVKARDAYWQALTEQSPFYQDAEVFFGGIQKLGISLMLMTSSDSILIPQTDLTFDYNPQFSLNYKKIRLAKTNMNYVGIVIGDPVDKPHELFFDRVEKELEPRHIAHERILFVGDSPRNDLEVPKKRGYRTLHIKRH